ncbi:hypothetical protein AVEN_90136-1, partial [Araneus ventricosus]
MRCSQNQVITRDDNLGISLPMSCLTKQLFLFLIVKADNLCHRCETDIYNYKAEIYLSTHMSPELGGHELPVVGWIAVPKSPSGFGFTVAWTKPPMVEFVNEGSTAEKAGVLPGDKIIYIDKIPVSKKGKEEIENIV